MIKTVNGSYKERIFPTTAACHVCRLQSTDVCEGCLGNNLNCFDPKKPDFFRLPRFSMEDYRELPGKIKGEILALYMMAVLEILNGNNT
jgi:hypothetical protein